MNKPHVIIIHHVPFWCAAETTCGQGMLLGTGNNIEWKWVDCPKCLARRPPQETGVEA